MNSIFRHRILIPCSVDRPRSTSIFSVDEFVVVQYKQPQSSASMPGYSSSVAVVQLRRIESSVNSLDVFGLFAMLVQ